MFLKRHQRRTSPRSILRFRETCRLPEGTILSLIKGPFGPSPPPFLVPNAADLRRSDTEARLTLILFGSPARSCGAAHVHQWDVPLDGTETLPPIGCLYETGRLAQIHSQVEIAVLEEGADHCRGRSRSSI